jgi:hypothetical protein
MVVFGLPVELTAPLATDQYLVQVTFADCTEVRPIDIDDGSVNGRRQSVVRERLCRIQVGLELPPLFKGWKDLSIVSVVLRPS